MSTVDQARLRLMDTYWSAANYLTIGQIYLQENALLREPLRPDLCWLLGTSVRKISRFLRTDVPSSQHNMYSTPPVSVSAKSYIWPGVTNI
jgi:XFP-like protein